MNAKTIALGIALTATVVSAPATASARPAPWRSAWASSQHAPADTSWNPNWSTDGFDNHSVRQVVRVGSDGTSLRVRVSNAYGTAPLRLTGATVARSAGGAAVRPETVREVRFHGGGSVTVPAGGESSSDPVALRVRAFERLTVTFYFRGATGPATFHNAALTTSYRASGNHLRDASQDAFAGRSSASWYYLAGVDVKGGARPSRSRNAVVAFGDSLTDGVGSTPDADHRYPDALADRLARSGAPRPVLNAGIGGNKVLTDSVCSGESALDRFGRDALDRTDVGTVIVLAGTNDIVQPAMPDDLCTLPTTKVTAAQIIAGHRRLIGQAHARGVRVLGGTLPPYGAFPYWNAAGEKLRVEVNRWIRTSGACDGVVDFDRAVADPEHPERIREEYVFPFDGIHLKDAGYKAMADAVDLNVL
ncbi:SGNH/GDSL hydrolase family protein [Streptomyces sp. NPDC050504]|uniref:SGNH/GDSL hydrolase family protein n=1 Tax=Streptomyces sp. NPDC050504 TaxID=3365618 RepID=UPI0037A60445